MRTIDQGFKYLFDARAGNGEAAQPLRSPSPKRSARQQDSARPAPRLGRRDRGQAGAGGEHRRVGDVDRATGVHILEPLLLARLPPLDQQAGLRGHLGRLQLNKHETHKTNYFQLDYVLQRNI